MRLAGRPRGARAVRTGRGDLVRAGREARVDRGADRGAVRTAVSMFQALNLPPAGSPGAIAISGTNVNRA